MSNNIDNLTILCPSKDRADKVITRDIIPSLVLVVPENQKKDYEKYNPEQTVVSPPKNIKGIVKTRQWILENYPACFMIDDDVVLFRKYYTDMEEEYLITSPQEILDIINMVYFHAKSIGAKTFGFTNIRRPEHFRSHKPILHATYMNASYTGFIKDHNLSYDTSYSEAEDHYMSCLNAYLNRYGHVETRYGFVTKDNFMADGGCNTYRTIDHMMENSLKLRRQFGTVIKLKGNGTKKNVNKGERSVSIPL